MFNNNIMWHSFQTSTRESILCEVTSWYQEESRYNHSIKWYQFLTTLLHDTSSQYKQESSPTTILCGNTSNINVGQSITNHITMWKHFPIQSIVKVYHNIMWNNFPISMVQKYNHINAQEPKNQVITRELCLKVLTTQMDTQKFWQTTKNTKQYSIYHRITNVLQMCIAAPLHFLWEPYNNTVASCIPEPHTSLVQSAKLLLSFQTNSQVCINHHLTLFPIQTLTLTDKLKLG